MEIQSFYKLFINQGFKYSTDTRSIEQGSVFFALKGASFNGNLFAASALDKGAAFAVIDEGEALDDRYIQVNDVLIYFQDLARFHRRCFDIPVIGIAGSNGKTTTKNLVYSVLAKKFKTHYTVGNFNNHIGVPKTLLDMPVHTEMAIIELGTNSPGEIEQLCNIALPNFGLITNIGKEHLEGFGTLEAVAKEESALYLHLRNTQGTAFVNESDDWLYRMARNIEHRVMYSRNKPDQVRVVPEISFSYKAVPFHSVLMGDYNLDNILAAVAIGEYFKVPLEQISAAIEQYRPENNRSQIIRKDSNLIWLDAYNANPSSMEKAISNFRDLEFPKKILILGDMFELGEHAAKEHLDLLERIQMLNFTEVLLLGKEFTEAAQKLGLDSFQSMDELKTHLSSRKYSDTAFLVKGSRGMKMEESIEAIS